MCGVAVAFCLLRAEVFGGYAWYRRTAGADGLGTDEYARVFFDRGPEHVVDALQEQGL